jgi:hypothetical protein
MKYVAMFVISGFVMFMLMKFESGILASYIAGCSVMALNTVIGMQ